jgi:hypothetical protein
MLGLVYLGKALERRGFWKAGVVPALTSPLSSKTSLETKPGAE